MTFIYMTVILALFFTLVITIVRVVRQFEEIDDLRCELSIKSDAIHDLNTEITHLKKLVIHKDNIIDFRKILKDAVMEHRKELVDTLDMLAEIEILRSDDEILP